VKQYDIRFSSLLQSTQCVNDTSPLRNVLCAVNDTTSLDLKETNIVLDKHVCFWHRTCIIRLLNVIASRYVKSM